MWVNQNNLQKQIFHYIDRTSSKRSSRRNHKELTQRKHHNQHNQYKELGIGVHIPQNGGISIVRGLSPARSKQLGETYLSALSSLSIWEGETEERRKRGEDGDRDGDGNGSHLMYALLSTVLCFITF